MNEEMLSYMKDGCYYVYHYRGDTFLTKVTKNNKDTKYKNGFSATDVAVIKSAGSWEMMEDWEIAQVASGTFSTVTLSEFYPNLETVMNSYAELFI